jgi:hypothetical protein
MKANEIITALGLFGIRVSKKENDFNGSSYIERYTLIDSDWVDGFTSYLGVPIKVKTQGFICKKGVLQNFYYHNGKGFETPTDIDTFLKNILQLPK